MTVRTPVRPAVLCGPITEKIYSGMEEYFEKEEDEQRVRREINLGLDSKVWAAVRENGAEDVLRAVGESVRCLKGFTP
jgi:hypothetical protein